MRIPAFLAGVAGLVLAAPGLAQPLASPTAHVELAEARREIEPPEAAAPVFPVHRDRFGDGLRSYGVQATVGAGLAHAWELELGSMLGSRLPVPIERAHISLDGIGWTAGGTVRPFYQWEEGWRGSVAMHARGFGSFDVTQSGAARGAKVRFEGGSALAFEATFGHAFSLRTSFAYVELGMEAQIVSVDLSVHLDGTGYVGDTRLYSLAFAPVPRVGWFIPIDNDFYADLTIDYRPTGLGGVGAGIGIGMSD
ncbi:MAG: hypothetical protein JNL21_02605 [Myxococcales bacterium]|nr:hypothetical protein [Myxococcales bacterium]